jgi:hypothetical protein
MCYNVYMERPQYQTIRLHVATRATLRKLAAFWGVSMLEAVDRLVSQAWAEEQHREQEKRDTGVQYPMSDTEDTGR